MAKYHHVRIATSPGWDQHAVSIEGYGAIFATFPSRVGSDEDRFSHTFLERAVTALNEGRTVPTVCRHAWADAGHGQRQHFISDEGGRPLLRTLYLPAGSELERHTQKFLQDAVAALGGRRRAQGRATHEQSPRA